jgi:hypothetical protein
MNYFSQLLNVHNVSDVRQIEVHTAEPLAPGSSRLEVEIAIAKLKKYKFPGTDQIPAEIHEVINSAWNKEDLPDQWKEYIIVPVQKKKVTNMAVIIILGYHCYQLHTKLL